jgi:hypothetical protein
MMACIVNNNSTPIERHGLHYLISGVSGQSQRQPRPLGRLTPGVSVSCACRQQGKGRVVRGRGAHTWRSPGVEARPNRSMTRRSIGRRAHLPRVRLRPFDEERERRCICMHPPAAESRKPSVAAKHARTRRALPCSAVLRRLYTASGSEAPAVVDLEAIAVREAETAATRCWIGGCIPPRPGKIYGANVFAGHIFISAGYQHRLHAGVILHIVRDLRPATRFSLI